ncbi:MAG: RNA methyltransferase [Bacteroidota bacterium]|nr:RNA methyltransferase [Bacteroidota bacterium]
MITKNQIKYIRGLSLKKNRMKEQCFIVEGEKSLSELLDSSFEIVELFALKDWINDNKGVFEKVQVVNFKELERISNLKSPNKVLAVVKIKNYQILSGTGVTLVLDDINDPGNMGTIIRMCDWFGVNSIVCSNNTVDSYNPKVVQSAMGSIFRVAITYTNLSDYLKGVKSPIYGSFMDGENLKNVSFAKNLHLVMGNEANGITKEISQFITTKVKIENTGKKTESLNVAVATSIFLHEIYS